jgi:hypothetical protein
MKTIVCILALVASLAAAPALGQGSVPDLISYQGRLLDSSGQPVTGPHNIQFQLYDVAAGGTAFWTSFSSGLEVGEGGLLTVGVGQLSTSVLAGRPEAWLEIVLDFQALSPRVKLMSVPYSLIAERALGVSNGSITSASIAPGQVVTSLNGLKDSVTLQAGNGVTINPSGQTLTISSTETGFTLPYEGTVASEEAAISITNTDSGPALRAIGNIAADLQGKVIVNGLVGIGEAIPYRPLDVYTTDYGDAIRAETTSTHGNGIYGIANTGSNAYGVYGSAMSGIGVRGFSSGNTGVLGTGGSYGVRGEGPTAVQGTGSTVGVIGTHSATGNYAELGRNFDAVHAVAFSGNGGYFQAPNGDGVYAESGAAGKSAVGAFQSNGGGYAVFAKNTFNGNYGFIGGSWCGVYGEAGGTSTVAAAFKGNVRVLSKSTGAVVAEIGEGLDYAEGFDLSRETEAEPGTVMVIDPDSPGKLTFSTEAYDRKVAGIVAGAEGLGSGVRLGAGKFDCDIALAGRVYCNVDATKCAVAPGDLLTTSSTPGHAMVVKDHSRARGAILGKAMEALPRGARGRILVLVTLQ